jgi:Nuclease-related domain
MTNSEPDLTPELGERAVADGLDAIDGVVAIHNRPVPGTRARIDHIVIGPSGVYVVDTNTHDGHVVRRDSRLFVDTQDRSDLIAAMKAPVEAVASALDDLHFPISRALCFVGGAWPATTPAFMLKGVWVGWSNPLYGLVSQPGRLQRREIHAALEMLSARLPAAD